MDKALRSFIHSHTSVHAPTMHCLTNAVSVQEPPDCRGLGQLASRGKAAGAPAYVAEINIAVLATVKVKCQHTRPKPSRRTKVYVHGFSRWIFTSNTESERTGSLHG